MAANAPIPSRPVSLSRRLGCCTPGVIASIQTFGARINLHVHLHFLVTEGGMDEAGVFHKIPRIDDSRLTFQESEGKIGYRWGRDGAEQETMDYLEFIAQVTSHIPDKGQVTVR